VLRFYIVPITQNGIYRSPSHFGGRAVAADVELVGVVWSMMDYGFINAGLVAANVDSTQQTYLDSLTDVQPVPQDIDTTVTGGQVTAIQNKLEAFNIPGTWVNVGDSYRTILREICGYFQFLQRYSALTGVDPTAQSISLNTSLGLVVINQWAAMNDRYLELKATMGDFSAFNQMKSEVIGAGLSNLNFYKASLLIVLTEMGYDTSAAVAGTTLRQILRGLAAQNDQKSFQIGGVTL
jgi:hypothetical protein